MTIFSFDIKPLYTNVPLNETINIILEQAFNNNNDKFKNFIKPQFKKLLELSLLDTYFIFDNMLYKQMNGLAMGQSVAPTLANIFLCFNEKSGLMNVLNSLNLFYTKGILMTLFYYFER